MPYSEIFEQYQKNTAIIPRKEYLSYQKETGEVDNAPLLVRGLRGAESETFVVIGNTGLFINTSTKPLELLKDEILITNIHFKPEGHESPVKGHEVRATLLGVMGLLGLIEFFDTIDPERKTTFITAGLPNNPQLKELLEKLPKAYSGIDFSVLRDKNSPARQQLERIATKAKHLQDVQSPWK